MGPYDDVPGPPLRPGAGGLTQGEIGTDRPPRHLTGRVWGLIACAVGFILLPAAAVLGLAAGVEAAMPSEEQMNTLLADAPSGTVVLSEDLHCGSAECSRTVTLAPPAGQTVLDVLDAMNVSSEAADCRLTKWWDWQRSCIGASPSGPGADVDIDVTSPTVDVYIYRRAGF